MRLAYYAGASTAAAAACLLKAFHERPNFYSATVYLSQSNACLLILTNLLLVLACAFIFALQRLLYGPLRPIEIEQLSEKAWYAVLDTLLAMPSFREDVGGWLLTMFVLLLAGKVWGWIGEGRVDILEQQPPANPRLFHARLASSLIVSVLFDVYMLNYCVETVMADPRPGMMVIFTFEFAILAVFSTFTFARYLMAVAEIIVQRKQMAHAIETRKAEIHAERAAARQTETADGTPAPAPSHNEEPIEVDENEVDIPGWEEKRRYLFALEALTDGIKLAIYIVFFTVSITFNGLPMHIMRDVYMTFASFSKRVTDYVAYRKATSDMNTRYPDATTEEIRGDACIVCRESMVAWVQPSAAPAQPAAAEGDAAAPEQPPAPAPAPAPTAIRRDEGLRAKKLPCGHILHLRCLKAWLERQQVCPTCRRPVVTAATEAQAQGRAPQQQGGAPGPNPPAAGQAQPPRQPPRLNRARIFNLGPVRLGFVNAPRDQIQNMVNQMQNQPDAPNAADQHGPNHLGLQEPYENNVTQSRTNVPTQIQIMHLEQRLMREAHNLGVEQQQLATLRMMEAELARLRAIHIPSNPPVGTTTAVQRQTATLPMGLPALPGQMQPTETLHGTQRWNQGHENLPPGLALPEGWTLMPLHRAETQTFANTHSQAQNVGPTDDRGSPLFVPTTPSTATLQPSDQSGATTVDSNTIADQTSQRPPASATADLTASNVQSRGPSASNAAPPPSNLAQVPTTCTPSSHQDEPSGQQAPWTSTNGWSFDGERAKVPETSTHGDPREEGEGYSGKGKAKAKAVEVEDAPDPEA